MNENQVGRIIVDPAVKLHIALGPGLLETVYEVILTHQLRGIPRDRKICADTDHWPKTNNSFWRRRCSDSVEVRQRSSIHWSW